MGIIETSSGELDAVRDEIRRMRALTDKPFGVNIAQNLVRDPAIVDFVVDNGVRFVTTSAGDPNRFTGRLKDAGLTVFHVVPSLRAALKAVDAGVDGLVVEGSEGGGFKNPKDVSTMVLLPLVASQVDVPIVAAGGFVDGRTMAAAFALGAEGVQMGTRMVATVESPVHDELEAGDRRRARDRHRAAEPPRGPGDAGAAHRGVGDLRVRHDAQRHGGHGPPPATSTSAATSPPGCPSPARWPAASTPSARSPKCSPSAPATASRCSHDLALRYPRSDRPLG